jgi:hypothetical protein
MAGAGMQKGVAMDEGLVEVLGAEGLSGLLALVGAEDMRVEGLVGVGGEARRCFRARKELFEFEGRTLFDYSTGLFTLTAGHKAFALTVATKDPESPVIRWARERGVQLRVIREPDWVRSNVLQILAMLSRMIREHVGGCAWCREGPEAIETCPGLAGEVLLLGCSDQYKEQPAYAVSELRAALLARRTERMVFVQQTLASVERPDLGELGATLVEAQAEGPAGERFGRIRWMKEKDPSTTSFMWPGRLLPAVNTMIGCGTPGAWLGMLRAAQPECVRIVLESAWGARNAGEAVAGAYEAARGTEVAGLDFSHDVHSRLPEGFEQYALCHEAGWDDKGTLRQLRPAGGGVYRWGGEVQEEGCEDVSAVVSPSAGDVAVHLLGVRGLSVLVKRIGGKLHVFVASDEVGGGEIKRYQKERGL